MGSECLKADSHPHYHADDEDQDDENQEDEDHDDDQNYEDHDHDHCYDKMTKMIIMVTSLLVTNLPMRCVVMSGKVLMAEIVNLCFRTFFWILRIEVIIYKESRTGAPRKRNLPASMEKERNLKLGRREIFALCEISGLREICDWLLVFFYTIFP